MAKKSIDTTFFLITTGLLFALFGNITVTAQDFDGKGGHFSLNLSLYADMIKYEQNKYEHQYLRMARKQKDTVAMYFPFSGMDWVSDDSNLSVGYENDWFGAKYSFKKSNIANFGAVRGWVKFGGTDTYLKIIAGNDNDFTYADSLGADPGLRVYTGAAGDKWTESKDTDNITQEGNGIAVRGAWNDLTLDLAASGFNITPDQTSTVKPGTVAEYGQINNIDFKYGGRMGWQFGEWGKVNASYSIKYEEIGTYFSWDSNGELVPKSPKAQIYNHYYGLFGTVKPIEHFEATLGYSGIATKYLDEDYSTDGNLETTYPLILKHGANLNFRYKGLLDGALRLRNDNSMTIFKDKDYSCFEVTGNATWGTDYNPTSIGKSYAEIQHFFIWNGLGVEYDIMEFSSGRRLMLSLYVRNLYRHDIATSNPNIVEQEYKFTRNEFFADLQTKYFFSGMIHVFAGLRMKYLTTFRSADLNGQNPGFFIDAMKMPREALATTDNKLTLSIPVGMILSW